jgi:glycerol-3-phosphate dehydrogenase
MQGEDGRVHVVRSRALVNAAGPWVEDVLQHVTNLNSCHSVRLVKGSHVVVPKFWAGSHAYLFQNDDRRVIFANPYEGDLALVGTTDIPYEGRAEDVAIDAPKLSISCAPWAAFCAHRPRPTTLFMPSPVCDLSMTIAPRIHRR